VTSELSPLHAPIRYATPIVAGQDLVLDASAMNALAFRGVNVKEAFTLQDSEGAFFRASLKSTDGKTSGRAVAYEKMRGSPESPAHITLVCAVLARQRMIFVTQKATELGVVRVVPVLTDKSVQPRDLDHEKPWAWPGQALKGAKQCRRASVPEVLPAEPLAKALDAPFFRDADARFLLDDVSGSSGSSGDPLANASAANRVVLAVGPEGGWSDRERALLVERGAVPLALGTRVLRAETAVLAGLAVVQHRLGDLRP
jgi:16S rRNA (uracil1498-N3)-methyltransferase